MADRITGTLPISVGTSLALEALPNAKMHLYSTLLINIRTIVRNAREAFDKETMKEELPKENDVFEAAKADLIALAEFIVSMKLKTTLELKIYYPSYASLNSYFPMAKLKDLTKGTPLQQAVAEIDKNVAKKLLKEFDKAIINVNCKIPDFRGVGLIFSHHPVDLVMTDSYTRLNLLESHTGTIKPYPMFYTKLTGSETMTNIPLNKLTIQIFGDKSTNFYSHSMSVKNEVKQLAEVAKWSTASTPSFVARTIRSLDKTPEKEILLKMI